MIDETTNAAKVDTDLDKLIRRRQASVSEGRVGQQAANAEEDHQRARESRRTHATRLVHARAWAEYFGGLSLAAHDTAARYAEKRDEARALVEELEATNGRKTA